MSDVITFNCTSCSKPYRVALSYAGRAFACKACGTHLTVPQPLNIQPQVELGSGGAVMRSTPSGRRVAVDPTRVFATQRETSGRMAGAGAARASAGRSRKGPLVAAVVVIALIAGLGGAWVAGLFDGAAAASGPSAQRSNTQESPPQREETERERILKQLDASGQSAAALMALFRRAEQAKLSDVELAMIGGRLVSALDTEQGGDFSDADLMSLAARTEALDLPQDAAILYGVVIARNRGKAEPGPEYRQARLMLDHHWLDFAPAVSRAAELRDSGLVEGMDKLYDELVAMEKRADEGWARLSDSNRFKEIAGLLDDGQAEYDRIRRDEPWRVKVKEAERLFRLEKASGIGNWETFWRDPFVIFVQLQGEEDRAAAEKRLEHPLACAAAFPAFFETEFREPLGLTRTLPQGLTQAEREAAPIVIKLFKDASHWQVYMREKGFKDFDGVDARTATEPGNGHVSLVFKDAETSMSPFIRALVDVVMYNYHPHAPTTLLEHKSFRNYSAWWLEDFLHHAMTFTRGIRRGGQLEMEFLSNDTRPGKILKTWKQPFAKDRMERVTSFGGSLLSARDMVEVQDSDELDGRMKTRMASLKGWTEADLQLYRAPRTLRSIRRVYQHGFFTFLFHWGPDDEPKYREKLLKFIRRDLEGEVDKENPLPAFEAAFGLDAEGWKQFEADWDAYQSQ